MKKTVKTEKVLAAWRVLSAAKYMKLEDADKIKVWKISRALQPVAKKFDEDTKDAADKLKPSEDFDERLQHAQEYERVQKDAKADASTLKMGPAEYQQFMKDLNAYNKLVGEAVKEFAEKEVEIDIETLTEESFGKLMNSNEWNFEQAIMVSEMICA